MRRIAQSATPRPLAHYLVVLVLSGMTGACWDALRSPAAPTLVGGSSFCSARVPATEPDPVPPGPEPGPAGVSDRTACLATR